jgi:predicted nucleotidyltransferase
VKDRQNLPKYIKKAIDKRIGKWHYEKMDINTVLDSLVFSLKSSDPYKIILFGSYANGNPNENSDIDLMVILDNNHVSKTYEERLNKKIFIRNLVLEINRKIPLDILVYSKEELNKRTGKLFY